MFLSTHVYLRNVSQRKRKARYAYRKSTLTLSDKYGNGFLMMLHLGDTSNAVKYKSSVILSIISGN